MNGNVGKLIKEATNATEIYRIEDIQGLWGGYGTIARYGIESKDYRTVIVKHIQLKQISKGPKDLSHKRKLRSYEVEIAWYKKWSRQCNDTCRIPAYLASMICRDEIILVLEDLSEAGFIKTKRSLSRPEIEACLSWLAHFHAQFLCEKPGDLWKTGSYWHLATRPDELGVMKDIPLKQAAQAIDRRLNSCRYQTIIHGDAKLANFCFSHDGKSVAVVDFQYVGGGCGIKDVMYFLDSCLSCSQSEKLAESLLDYYFLVLRKSIACQQKSCDLDALENEWRILYPFAWADFHRFLKGWIPGFCDLNGYGERLTQQVVKNLNNKAT